MLANSRFAYAVTFSNLDEDFYNRARAGEVAITRTDITNRIRAGVRLNSLLMPICWWGGLSTPRFPVLLTEPARRLVNISRLISVSLTSRFPLPFSSGWSRSCLLSAVWLGLNFANAIVLPLVSVIQAAEDVRLGDLSSRVEIGRKNDEIAQLGKSFNEMLDKINKNREELVQANKQLDKRRSLPKPFLVVCHQG